MTGRKLRPVPKMIITNIEQKNIYHMFYTEQGIAMLSGLLKNDIAIQVSINIMNAFVEIYAHVPNSAYKLFYKEKCLRLL